MNRPEDGPALLRAVTHMVRRMSPSGPAGVIAPRRFAIPGAGGNELARRDIVAVQ